MDNFQIGFYSALCSTVLGAFWGVVIALFDVQLGLIIGFSLFLFCFVILYNNAKYSVEEEEEEKQHNRRFNDV